MCYAINMFHQVKKGYTEFQKRIISGTLQSFMAQPLDNSQMTDIPTLRMPVPNFSNRQLMDNHSPRMQTQRHPLKYRSITSRQKLGNTKNSYWRAFNRTRPWQNGHHFADNNSKCPSLEVPIMATSVTCPVLALNFCILFLISIKFVPIGIQSLSVQVIAWCLFCTKPLSEPMTQLTLANMHQNASMC